MERTQRGAAEDDWQQDAECLGQDPELFFPTGDTQRYQTVAIEAAKEVCRRCVVRVECLETALETNEDFGIWGGLTERERRRVRGSRQHRARIITL